MSLKQFLNDKSNKSEIDHYFDEQARFYIEKKKLETIDNFNGYFDFLNNEFPAPTYYDGLIYKTVSHAYQAARSQEQHIREKIVRADTVMEMYEIAAKVEDPEDWNKIRLKVMETLVRDKFRRNADLREKLRTTETRSLVNSYADPSTSNLFWGMVEGKGQNHLGRILENIRNDIHHNVELEKWLFMTFKLEENKNLQPKIQLDVIKGDAKVEEIKLEGKSYHFLGKLVGSDVLMAHQSISRRHAVLICDSQMGVCLVDLGSKGGSFLNKQKLDNCFPYRLKVGDTMNFGASTRRYKAAIDYSEVEKYLTRKQKDMKKQYEQMETLNDPNANPDALKATLGVIVNNQAFVAGLPDNTSHREIEKLFGEFGEVKEAILPIDKKTGKTKGFAIITFKNPKDCEKAVASDGLQFKDRKLKIRWAEKRGDDDRRDNRDSRMDKSHREKYADAIKGNEGKVSRDVDKRYKRRSRSPRDSRRKRDDDRDRRRDRKRRSKSREKRKETKKRSKNRSKSSSSSDSESKSKSESRSRSKSKEKDRKERQKADVKKDKPRFKDEPKRSEKDESKSRSRSKNKDKNKKKDEKSSKRASGSKEKKDRKKKEVSSESESSSGSGSDNGSGSDSSEGSDNKKKK